MRGRPDGGQKKRLITSVCVVAVFLIFLYVYFGSHSDGESALEYGSRSLRKLGSSYLGGDEDADLGGKQDESATKFGLEDGEDGIIPKSFPVCDDRHSELIPCLDRNLIYQMRLKLDLTLMEHYERHCPPAERRFNCLIPPPSGYKIPIKWPKSRDEVWKANIPHTHLAHEKSDQNWMVVKGEKIIFPGGGTHFHYGADKYIASLANMLNFSNNNLNNEGNLRTVLDVGCGVASFGAYLLSSDIITMSLAPNDVHHDHRTKGSELSPWPRRLTAPPPRLSDFGYSNEMFEKDTELWQRRVEKYWNLLSPKISSDTLRNVMDMKANLGSFGAALKEKDVWVMNVVPEDGPNTLKLIYDRGLIGTVHSWCEAFSTYPRTYDLLHAWTVFSEIEKKGCSAEDLLLEMDRILRPTGFIIIRDKQPVIKFVKKYLQALHWETVATSDLSSDSDQDGDDFVFVIQKKLWLTSESLRDSE
ncbi:Methyltransferase [Actinidia chinensis var. chinensis]|uniref:Methyltransferase n=1 Tax=Actinidia chinensis var. chinensis TaxID=1590841 RepID=A0A2R6PW21_ACTCC|nr:Methyltransferase [Actinidia chinensis var. chinensis]